MGAAIIGCVEHENIAGADIAFVLADGCFYRAVHGPQMDGHMRGVGDQGTLGVKDCAGEVETLFDVDGLGGVLKGGAHLLGDRHEEIVENLKEYRIGFCADCMGALFRGGAAEDKIISRG